MQRNGEIAVSCMAGIESTTHTALRQEKVDELHPCRDLWILMCQKIKGRQPVKQRGRDEN